MSSIACRTQSSALFFDLMVNWHRYRVFDICCGLSSSALEIFVVGYLGHDIDDVVRLAQKFAAEHPDTDTD